MNTKSKKVYAIVLKYTMKVFSAEANKNEYEEMVSVLFYSDRDAAEKRIEETKKQFTSPGFTVKSTIIECDQFDKEIGIYATEFTKHLN